MRQNDMEGRRNGYSESWVITRLNMEILSFVNHRGFEEAAIPFPVPGSESPFRERALTALRDEFGDSRLFVLKDARVCLLLRFWLDAVETFGARPVVICPIRNPLEVARSIKSRDKGDARFLMHLLLRWLRYALDAEAASRHVPRAFTRYEDLVEDPSAVLGQAAAALDVSWPKMSSPKTGEEIRAFLSPAHRHHEFTHDDLRSAPRCSQSVRRVFDILDRWADGDVRTEDTSELDRIKAIVDDVTAVLAGRGRCHGNVFSQLDELAHNGSAARRQKASETNRDLSALRFRSMPRSRTGIPSASRHARNTPPGFRLTTQWETAPVVSPAMSRASMVSAPPTSSDVMTCITPIGRIGVARAGHRT